MPYLEFIAALLGAIAMIIVIYNDAIEPPPNWIVLGSAALCFVGFMATLVRLWRLTQ